MSTEAIATAVPVPAYRILGPLQIIGAGDLDGRIPPGRQQVVLAALLLDANRVVSIDHLIDTIWSDEPPATARTQVQICVSRLRTSLHQLGQGATIVTRLPGYLLRVVPELVDVSLFGQLVTRAEMLTRDGDLPGAARSLEAAIGLWRGPALSGVSSRVLEAKAAQLEERRLAAIETRADLDLRLGRHHQVIGDIGVLVEEFPLRERLRGQLMLALYRSGRQAEALETYRRGRDMLIDQLGLEPGEYLRKLEFAILAGDETLLPAREPVITRPDAKPHLLPADVADFVGRDDLIAEVRRLVGGPVRVVALAGKPGVGKSALAVHLAHRLPGAEFPDGELYMDLSGTRAQPTSSEEVLGRFLRALGIPGDAIPDGVDERAEMYRSLLAERRMLVVLDDVTSEAQVRPLLPGSGRSAVLVTSRIRLTGLPGVRVLDVEVMEGAAAVDLLAAVIGRARVVAEPAAADAIVRLIGGLPLALRIVAARLAARPNWSLAWMQERLSDERRRLDELAHGELMVRASLVLTYDGLEPAARRLLRLLAGLDVASIPTWVGAALLDTDLFTAADLLEVLVDVQMLEIVAVDLNGTPRYKFHDIIRLFARERLEADPADDAGADDWPAAFARVAGGWLELADRGHRGIYGGDFVVLHGDAPRWPVPARYAEQVLVDGFDWFEAERANLLAVLAQAADAGLDELCWDLAVTMVTLFESRCYYQDWQSSHDIALAAARAAGNRRGVAALTNSLGSMHLGRGRVDEARELVMSALAEFDALDAVHGRAMARRNLGLLDHIRHDIDPAELSYRAAMVDFETARDTIGQAHVMGQLGQICLDRGELAVAEEHLTRALLLCRGVGSRRVEVQVRFRQCELMVARKEFRQAADSLLDLLDLVRAGRDLVGESRILCRLSTTYEQLGDVAGTERMLRAVIAVREQMMDAAGAASCRRALVRLVGAKTGAKTGAET